MGTYQCRMKGCVGSGSFTMEPGEEDWHMQKFGHLPTNCPACRAFKKAQTDVDITCSACDFTFTVFARQIIGWHIHNGIWEKPTLCKLCEEDPNRAQRKLLHKQAKQVADRFYDGKADHPRQHLLRPVEKRWFRRNAKRKVANAREYLVRWIKARKQGSPEDLRKLSEQWTVSSVELTTDKAEYKRKFDKEHGDAYEHLIRHFRDHRPEGEDERVNLQRIGVKSESDVLTKLNEIVSTNDPDQIVEFRDAKSGYLIKYHFETESAIVIHDRQRTIKDKSGNVVKVDEPPPPPPYVKTCNRKGLKGVAIKMQNSDGKGWVPNLIK